MVPWEQIERAEVAEQLLEKEAQVAKEADELCCQSVCVGEKEASRPPRRVEWVASGLVGKAQKMMAMEARPYGMC